MNVPHLINKKYKILALHGYEQTASILRTRIGGLPRKIKSATFHFLDGPIELELREGQTESLRSWWHRKAPYEIEEASLQETLKLVIRTWEEYGPFDGILGFSMGGVLACQIAIRLSFPTYIWVVIHNSPMNASGID